MLQTTVVGKTVVLCANGAASISPALFNDPILLYVNLKNFKTTDFETIDVPLDENETEIYFNNNNLYLTNFTFDQSVLPTPIDLIVASKLNIHISGKNFKFLLHQLSQEFSSKKLYLDMYHSFLEVRTQNTRKRKLYAEKKGNHSSLSASSELGVYTLDGTTIESSVSLESLAETVPLSEFSESGSPRESDSIEDVEGSEIFPINPVNKIRKTILDTRKTKKIEIESYKKKVLSLQTDCNVKTTDTVIFSDALKPTKQYSDNDVTLNRMGKEVSENGNGQLSTIDPVVVVERDGCFNVLSGNRRVHALKKMTNSRIWVSKIDKTDQTKFLLTHFFRSQSNKEFDTHYLFEIMSNLLTFLELPTTTLKSWSPCERNQVFSSLFGQKTIASLILEISSHEQLKEAVLYLVEATGWNLSHKACQNILMVNRRNPTEAIIAMKKSWNSESELRQGLTSIQPDLLFLLEEKKIEPSIAKSLVLRFVTEKLDSSTFDVLVTSSKKTATATLARFQTIVVFLFGSTLPTIPECTVVLPDYLGVEDKFGKLHNHITLSLCIKVDGELLNFNEVTTFLLSHGVINRTVFTLTQLNPLTQKFRKYYFDFGGIVREELSLLLFSKQEYCIYEKEEFKKKMETYMKKQRHTSQMDP